MGLTRDQEIDYADERGHRDPDHQGLALLDRRQPVGPLVRDGRARGPVGHAAGRRLRVDRRPGRRARPGRGHDRASRAGSRSRSTASGSGAGGARGAAPRARRRARRRAAIDHVEDRLVGIKSREIYEAPAATILHAAHRALEGLTLSQGHAPLQPAGRRRAGPADLRRAVVQRPVTRPARLRGVVAAGRVGRGPDAPRPWAAPWSRVGARRCRCTTSTLATYDEGDAFDHAVGRRASSRSSGCRSGSRRRATAPSASTTAPPGPGRDRSWRDLPTTVQDPEAG